MTIRELWKKVFLTDDFAEPEKSADTTIKVEPAVFGIGPLAPVAPPVGDKLPDAVAHALLRVSSIKQAFAEGHVPLLRKAEYEASDALHRAELTIAKAQYPVLATRIDAALKEIDDGRA